MNREHLETYIGSELVAEVAASMLDNLTDRLADIPMEARVEIALQRQRETARRIIEWVQSADL